MNKIKTGIAGLDEMLNGGLIDGRPYLIAGGPGAGKTILAMQFLIEGTRNREKGLYISLEESAEQLREDMATFGWNLDLIKIVDTTQELSIDKWLIKSSSVLSKPEFTLQNLIKVIKEKLDTYSPKRIVIDSITSIRLLYENKSDMRREILSLMNFLSNSGCTSLITSETGTDSETSRILMEEFLASGVIKLHTIERRGEIINAISIEKIRGSDFDKHLRPIKISNEGVVIFPNETVFE